MMAAERRARRAHTVLVEDRAARLERELGYLAREAVADERARLTRELHETVTANLSMIVAQAKVAERALPVGAAPLTDAVDFILHQEDGGADHGRAAPGRSGPSW